MWRKKNVYLNKTSTLQEKISFESCRIKMVSKCAYGENNNIEF